MASSIVIRRGLIALAIGLVCADEVWAKSPWQWVTFRRGDDRAKSSLALTDARGPWLIFAASFAGDGAREEALSLVQELRSRYRLSAYIHTQHFDFSDTVEGIGMNPDRSPKRMRYDKASEFDEYAVLIGDYASVDDPDLQATLKRIKYARPQCLSESPENTTRRFAGLRTLYSRVNKDEEKRRKGPLGNAFATPNPLIPAEFFAPKGVDSFVIEMNQGVAHSLLDCPGKYSVRIATFRGNVVIDQEQVAAIEQGGRMKSQLEEAALKAHKMTVALRKRGIEAYEFHDRHESCVTVGSFEWVGRPQSDGTSEMNPEILSIVQRYSPQRQPLTGARGQALDGLQPRTIERVPCDVQPWPIEVPKRSVAVDYAGR